MPYIEEKRRKILLNGGIARDAGELNFIITENIKIYLKMHGESYKTYNDIMGVLSCSGLELYRRKISPYEDLKIKENGDVYDQQ